MGFRTKKLVNCRTGSLEKAVAILRDIFPVNCRTGSLETSIFL
ncbi:hypothetical protein MTBBW1_530014 [Desulfamplus magnetovallimortis]|uniref:Uncharacterized protein n=1 Tax=Desulfamplus magnetovallimortis TaxID=1246637 RepID=A0A1W1HHQ5_9BACT|nr:hypothetical protein MTBBW1_530014 [Desulfamplus magnetovallimortis]